MSFREFKDPRNEYDRICPYCKDVFVADHLSREYCPSKEGIKNFCKNRFKRMKKTLLDQGIQIDKPERQPLKITINDLTKRRTVDDVIHDVMRERNIKILEEVLDHGQLEIISLTELIKKGFEIDCYDEIILNDGKIPFFELEKFTFGILDDHTFITYTKDLNS